MRNTINTKLKDKHQYFLLRLCLVGVMLALALGMGNPRPARAGEGGMEPLPEPPGPVPGYTPQDTLNKTLLQAQIQFANGKDYRISELHSHAGFAFATASYSDISIDQQAPVDEFIPLLARQDASGNWVGIAPGLVSNRVFNDFLKSFPDDLIDESTRAFFHQPEKNEIIAGFFSEYKLPWPAGQTAWVSQKNGYGHEFQVDFVINAGQVFASKPGTVVFVKESSNYGCSYSIYYCWKYANMVVIQHSTSEYSWYVHLAYNSVEVSVGDTVGFGKRIGWQGNTGYSTGNHLHFMTSTGHTTWTDPGNPGAAPWATGITTLDFVEVPWDDISVGATYYSQNSEYPICYSLFVNSQGSGSAYATPASSSCGVFSYPAGTMVQLSALPNAGWHFDHWNGGASGSAVTNFIVYGNVIVTAVFLENSLIPSPPDPPPPPASAWQQTFFSDINLRRPCGSPREESDVYMFRDSQVGWSPPDGCPAVENSWSVRMLRSDAYFEGGNYTFGLSYDDRARLYIDNNLIINGWTADQHYRKIDLTRGDHELRLEYSNNDGHAILGLWWRGPGALPGNGETKDSSQWWANYWGDQAQWQDPMGQRNEGTGFLDRDWGMNSPGFGLPGDHFSTSYERTLGFECGTYRFHLKSEDGSRLWIDGALIPALDHWSTNYADNTADVTLTNADHVLRVDQFENDEYAYVHLDWSLLAACSPLIPSRPANVNASDGVDTDKVRIAWDTVPNAIFYQVWRNTGNSASGASLLNSPLTSPFEDTTATPGLTYYYRLKACQDTSCSWFSSANTGWRKLKPPTYLQASDGASPDKIWLNWAASNGATSYKVFRSASRLGVKTLLGRATGTTYVDTSATPGVLYYYRVQACKGARCSAFSRVNTGWRRP